MDGAAGRRPLTLPRQPAIPDGLEATVVLLRHGESTAIVEGRFQGRSDVPLSPVGQRQAELAGRRLARPHATPALPVPAGNPLEIVHSPLARAAETARAVAEAAAGAEAYGQAIPLRPDPSFSEIGQGEWEGRLASEIAAEWGEVLAAWRRDPVNAHAPGGEALVDVRSRVTVGVGRLLEDLGAASGGPAAAAVEPAPDRPLVPGYGGATPVPEQPWAILVAHDGVFKVTLLTLLGLPLEAFWIFPFALCGITVVELRGGRVSLRAHNLTDHLGPLLEERAQVVSEARERSGAL